MKVKITCKDIDAVLRGIRSSVTELGKTHEKIAKTAAGQFAVELANATNPPFFKESDRGTAGFRNNIVDEVEDAFPAKSAWWARLVSTKGRAFAAKWWVVHRLDEESGMQLLRDHGIELRQIDVNYANHRQTRTNKHAHVAKRWDGRFITDDDIGRRTAYTIARKKNVGLAKAAWLKAASMATGGKSRVGGKAVGWVRKLEGRTSGSGSITTDGNGFVVSLTSGIPYADEAENPRMISDVRARTMERMGKYLKTMVRAVAKKAKMTEIGGGA